MWKEANFDLLFISYLRITVKWLFWLFAINFSRWKLHSCLSFFKYNHNKKCAQVICIFRFFPRLYVSMHFHDDVTCSWNVLKKVTLCLFLLVLISFFFFFDWFQDTVLINNKAKIISSDIISTNGIIHIIDKLLSPQNLLVTPKDASGRILVGELIVRLSAWNDSQYSSFITSVLILRHCFKTF